MATPSTKYRLPEEEQHHYDARHVVRPNGKTSRTWQPARSRDGLPIIRATFRQPDCRPAPTGPTAPARRPTPGT